MKNFRFIFTLILTFINSFIFATNVTFRVDMGETPINDKGIHLTGTVNNWKFDGTPMLLVSNNIYEVTLDLEAGKNYEYKFFNGITWDDGEFAYGPCANGGFREVKVGTEAIVLETVPFGLCNEKFGDQIKVACIGNSITYGYGLKEGERFDHCYPSQLQKILGNEYIAYNFGHSSKTLSRAITDSYWKTIQFELSHKKFAPDKVVIMLGTNDSKPFIWEERKVHFEEDMIAFFESYKNLASTPTIYFVTPPFAYSSNFDISNQNIEEEIIPIIKKVTKSFGINLIDMHTVTAHKKELFPDDVHPNQEGASIIAKKVASIITIKSPEIIHHKKYLSTATNGVEYRWYDEEKLIGISSKNKFKINAEKKHYRVAIKLTENSDDWVVSE